MSWLTDDLAKVAAPLKEKAKVLRDEVVAESKKPKVKPPAPAPKPGVRAPFMVVTPEQQKQNEANLQKAGESFIQANDQLASSVKSGVEGFSSFMDKNVGAPIAGALGAAGSSMVDLGKSLYDNVEVPIGQKAVDPFIKNVGAAATVPFIELGKAINQTVVKPIAEHVTTPTVNFFETDPTVKAVKDQISQGIRVGKGEVEKLMNAINQVSVQGKKNEYEYFKNAPEGWMTDIGKATNEDWQVYTNMTASKTAADTFENYQNALEQHYTSPLHGVNKPLVKAGLLGMGYMVDLLERPIRKLILPHVLFDLSIAAKWVTPEGVTDEEWKRSKLWAEYWSGGRMENLGKTAAMLTNIFVQNQPGLNTVTPFPKETFMDWMGMMLTTETATRKNDILPDIVEDYNKSAAKDGKYASPGMIEAAINQQTLFGVPLISIFDTITSYSAGLAEAKIAPVLAQLGLTDQAKTLEFVSGMIYPTAMATAAVDTSMKAGLLGKEAQVGLSKWIDANDLNLDQTVSVLNGIAVLGSAMKVAGIPFKLVKNFSLADQKIDGEAINKDPEFVKKLLGDFQKNYVSTVGDFTNGKLNAEDVLQLSRIYDQLPQSFKDFAASTNLRLYYKNLFDGMGGYAQPSIKTINIDADTLRSPIKGDMLEADRTVVHELAHLMEPGIKADPELGKAWTDLTEGKNWTGKGGLVEGMNYAMKNPAEYFAEGMSKFIKEPEILKVEDEGLYNFMAKAVDRFSVLFTPPKFEFAPNPMYRWMGGEEVKAPDHIVATDDVGRGAHGVPMNMSELAKPMKDFASGDEYVAALRRGDVPAVTALEKFYGADTPDELFAKLEEEAGSKYGDLKSFFDKVKMKPMDVSVSEGAAVPAGLEQLQGQAMRYDTFDAFKADMEKAAAGLQGVPDDVKGTAMQEAIKSAMKTEAGQTLDEAGMQKLWEDSKAMPRIYRGVNAEVSDGTEGKSNYGHGLYVTDSKTLASLYGDKILEGDLSEKAKFFDDNKGFTSDELQDLRREGLLTWDQVQKLESQVNGKGGKLPAYYQEVAWAVNDKLSPGLEDSKTIGRARNSLNKALSGMGYDGVKYSAFQASQWQMEGGKPLQGNAYLVFDSSDIIKGDIAGGDIKNLEDLKAKKIASIQSQMDKLRDDMWKRDVTPEQRKVFRKHFNALNKQINEIKQGAFMPRMKETAQDITKRLYEMPLKEGYSSARVYSDSTGKPVGSIAFHIQGDTNYKGETGPLISISKIESDIAGTGAGSKVVNDLKNLADLTNSRLAVDWVEPQSIDYWKKMGFEVEEWGSGTNKGASAMYRGSQEFMPRMKETVDRNLLIEKYNVSAEQGVKIEQTLKDLELDTRTVKSFEQMKAGAAVLLENPELLLRTDPKMLTSDQTVALKQLVNSNFQFITKAEKTLQIGDSTDPRLLKSQIDHAQTQIERAIQILAPGLTEQGRAVVSNKIMMDKTMDYAYWATKATQALGPNVKDQRLQDVLGAIKELVKDQNRMGLASLMAQLPESGFVDKLVVLWKAGLLTSPSTHIKNMGSNIVFSMFEAIKDVPATAMDKVLAAFTGNRTVSLIGLTDQFKGIPKGWLMAQDVMKYGTTLDDLGKAELIRRTNFSDSAMGHAADKYTQFIFRTLGAEDKIFRGRIEYASIAQQAKVTAINEGLKGADFKARVDELISTPTPAMLKIAQADSAYGTFNNDNPISNAISGAKKTMQGNPVGTLALESAAPFVRTPTNVALAIADYSPIGFVKSIAEMAMGKQRAAALDFGRGVTGSLVIGLGALLAQKGMMTGTYPASGDEKKQFTTMGLRGGDLMINGKAYNMMGLSPVGNLLQIGAALYQNTKEEGPQGVVTTAIEGAKGLTEQTFLLGLSSMLKAVTDPKREAKNYVANMISGMIPTVLRQLGEASDKYQRDGNEWYSKLQMGVPGWRQTDQPRLDVFGEPMKTSQEELLGDSANFVSKALVRMVDPFQTREIKSNDLIEEYNRLGEAGIASAYPSVPADKGQKTFTFDDGTQQTIKWTMSPETYNVYQELTGKLMASAQEELIHTEEYQRLDDEDKADQLDKIYKQARTAAFALVSPLVWENPDLYKEMSGPLKSERIQGIKDQMEVKPEWPTRLDKSKLFPRSEKVNELVYQN